MTMYGADVDQLRRLAADFNAVADELDDHGGATTRLLNNISWLGDVATNYLNDWTGGCIPQIGLSTRFIREAADQLTQHAAEQEAASGSGGPSGTPFRDLDDPALEADNPTTEPDESDDGELRRLDDLPLYGDGSAPRPEHVRQGALGDCWLASGMAAVALTNPELVKRLITDNGNGTYTVHFVDGDITVDDEIYMRGNDPIYAGQNVDTQDAALWPAIIEKAYAIHEGGSYGDLAGGHANNFFELIGAETETYKFDRSSGPDPSATDIGNKVRGSLRNGMPVTVNVYGEPVLPDGSGHAYTVLKVESVDGIEMVEIRNPWATSAGLVSDSETASIKGTGSMKPLDLGEYSSSDVIIDGANIMMPLDVLKRNFSELELVTEWK